MKKQYKYYWNEMVFRVADGKTERYSGNGKWTSTPCNPAERGDPKSLKYDYGETSKETEEEALRLMAFEDENR